MAAAVSAAFPQLYLSQVMDCDENTVKRSARNVTAAINRLHSYRRADGSLSYWPGSTSSSSFGTAYALMRSQDFPAVCIRPGKGRGTYRVMADDLTAWLAAQGKGGVA